MAEAVRPSAAATANPSPSTDPRAHALRADSPRACGGDEIPVPVVEGGRTTLHDAIRMPGITASSSPESTASFGFAGSLTQGADRTPGGVHASL